jgi:predicted transcriptional regulator
MVEGYKMIDSVKAVIESTGEDETEFDALYEKANTMADIAGIGNLSIS